MDTKINHYRGLLKAILNRYIELFRRQSTPGQEPILVIDEEHDHYFLHTIGWQGVKRVWNTTLYVRLKDGKFWIEIDWLEEGIATDLLAAGVSKEDIVLGFKHPELRPYTEFAVA